MAKLREVIARLQELDGDTEVAAGVADGEFWMMAIHLNPRTQGLVVEGRIRAYHFLLSRENAEAPWVYEFGDYNRDVVAAERDDFREKGHRAMNLRVMTCPTDRDADIQAMVRALNEGVAA